MQTFLPDLSFKRSAEILDPKRLGNQRNEARTILASLINGGGWKNHPAVKMWRGYEEALKHYGNVIIEEWVRRGYDNQMQILPVEFPVLLPPWIGLEELHASHRSNLLRKDLHYYNQFGWEEGPDLPYYWPKYPSRRDGRDPRDLAAREKDLERGCQVQSPRGRDTVR